MRYGAIDHQYIRRRTIVSCSRAAQCRRIALFSFDSERSRPPDFLPLFHRQANESFLYWVLVAGERGVHPSRARWPLVFAVLDEGVDYHKKDDRIRVDCRIVPWGGRMWNGTGGWSSIFQGVPKFTSIGISCGYHSTRTRIFFFLENGSFVGGKFKS